MFDFMSGYELLIVAAALVVGFVSVRWLISTVTDKSSSKAQSGQSNQGQESQSSFRAEFKYPPWRDLHDSDSDSRTWYDVLGVEPAASLNEIRAAYKRKISQYHPDKVAGLGKEFSVIAEKKSKEINLAYKQAMALRS